MEQLYAKVMAVTLVVEVLTNTVKAGFPSLPRRYAPLVAGILGILLSWSTQTGILGTLQIPVKHILLDYLITGIVISRGANIVHDLAKTLSVSR